MFIHIKHQCN